MEQPVNPMLESTRNPLRHKIWLWNMLAWIRDLSVSVLIACFLILVLYRPVKVEGTSMMPVLSDQDQIFINQFVYQFEDISRGDVVVFRYPHDPTKSYIKRVIGLPGDTVEVDRGIVSVNGKIIAEPYVPVDYRDELSAPRTLVGANQYYVMGDHRSSSNDSRSWGPVPRTNIYGKAVFAYWPLSRLGLLR